MVRGEQLDAIETAEVGNQGRPKIAPPEIAENFRNFLTGGVQPR